MLHKELRFLASIMKPATKDEKNNSRTRKSATTIRNAQRVGKLMIIILSIIMSHFSSALNLAVAFVRSARESEKIKRSFCKMSHQLARSSLTISFRFFYIFHNSWSRYFLPLFLIPSRMNRDGDSYFHHYSLNWQINWKLRINPRINNFIKKIKKIEILKVSKKIIKFFHEFFLIQKSSKIYFLKNLNKKLSTLVKVLEV